MNIDQNTVDSTEPAQRNPGPDQNQEEAGSELRKHGKGPLGGAEPGSPQQNLSRRLFTSSTAHWKPSWLLLSNTAHLQTHSGNLKTMADDKFLHSLIWAQTQNSLLGVAEC